MAFSSISGSMSRAIITNICSDGVEVHYIDHGSYEKVNRRNLKSVIDVVRSLFCEITAL